MGKPKGHGPVQIEYVYVGDAVEWVKIGIAANVKRRAKELHYYGVKRIVRTWHRPDDCRQVEFQVRWLLRDKKAPTRGQECFSVTPDEAVAIVEQAISDVEMGTHKRSPSERKRDLEERRNREWEEMMERLHGKD